MAKRPSILDRLLGRNKPEVEPHPTLPSAVQPEPQYEDFTEVGGSPTPGITLKRVLPGPTSSLNSNAWSPDGKYLATVADVHDFGIKIWDIARGDSIHLPVEKMAEHKRYSDDDFIHSLPSIVWSPDGQYLAACYSFYQDHYTYGVYDTSTIYVWDANNWEVILKTDPDLDGTVNEIMWSPDISTIAACSGKKGLLLINTKNGEIRNKTLDGKVAKHAVWSPDGDRIILLFDYKTQLYNPSENRFEPIFQKYNPSDSLFKWHPNGQLLASYELKANICIVGEVIDNKLKGNLFVSGGSPTTIRIWDIENGTLQKELEGHITPIQDLYFSSDGQLFEAWDLAGNVTQQEFDPQDQFFSVWEKTI